MLFVLRAGIVIGAIAWLSPVRDRGAVLEAREHAFEALAGSAERLRGLPPGDRRRLEELWAGVPPDARRAAIEAAWRHMRADNP